MAGFTRNDSLNFSRIVFFPSKLCSPTEVANSPTPKDNFKSDLLINKQYLLIPALLFLPCIKANKLLSCSGSIKN